MTDHGNERPAGRHGRSSGSTRSFRVQLALRFTLTMTLAVAAISAVSFLTLRWVLDRELDASILNVASIQAASVAGSPSGEMEFHEWQLTPDEARSVRDLIRFAQVWRADDGRSLLRSRFMTRDLPLDTAALRAAAEGELVWSEDRFQGSEVRSVYYPLERFGQAHERHVLQVAAPLAARNEMLWTVGGFLGGLTLLVLGGSLIGSWWLAGRAVRPVHEIIDQAEAIEAGSLQRGITAYSDTEEYERLVQVLDSMVERIRAAFEAQKRFTADASHELRSPLTAMRGELELALRRERSREEYREVLESTLEEVLRLSRITENLLTLARSDAGAIHPRRRETEVDRLIRDTLRRLGAKAEEKGVEWSVEVPDGLVADVDADLVRQLLWNLVDNAVKHTPAGSRVEISAERTGEELRLEVTDDGPGLGPSPNEVFRRFHRSDQVRTPQSSDHGTGLGLSIVQAVAEAHGGDVTAENRDPVGARFRVQIPLPRSRAHPTEAEGRREAVRRG